MIAIIWKEFRENFKWALLAMLGLGGALCYALYRDGYSDYYYPNGITLCKKSFLLATTFGFAAAGLVLGLVQILPELKRDRWAALLHRPTSRGSIYLGKAISGLLLYLAAAGVPFLLTVWLVATPGNFPVPFVPGMVRPGLADLCAGLPYYFAGLLLALQRGWWVRVFPPLAAVWGTYFTLHTDSFRVATEASFLVAAILAIAGWGAVHDRESLRGRPRLGQLAMLATVFFGACGLGALAASLGQLAWPTEQGRWQGYASTKEGLPLLFTYDNYVVTAVTQVDGTPVTDPKLQPDRVRDEQTYPNDISDNLGPTHGWTPPWKTLFYRESGSYLSALDPITYPQYEQWFELGESDTMIGFRPQEGGAVERLDGNGFTPISTPPKSFPPGVSREGLTETYSAIKGPDFVRLAFLPKRSMVDLALPGPGPVAGVGRSSVVRDDDSEAAVIGVALPKQLALYDEDGKFLVSHPFSHDPDRWGQISLVMNPQADRFYIWSQPSLWMDRETRASMPSYVEEMDRQGSVLRTWTLPGLNTPPAAKSWTRRVARNLQAPTFFFGTMVYQKIGAILGSTRLADALATQLGRDGAQTRLTGAILLALSLVLAGLAFVWARRDQFTRKQAWAWAGFVLLFNLAGFIVFRLCADWPSSIPCPACARRRRLDTEHCPHCGAGWPTPPRLHSEIFDDPVEGNLIVTK